MMIKKSDIVVTFEDVAKDGLFEVTGELKRTSGAYITENMMSDVEFDAKKWASDTIEQEILRELYLEVYENNRKALEIIMQTSNRSFNDPAIKEITRLLMEQLSALLNE